MHFIKKKEGTDYKSGNGSHVVWYTSAFWCDNVKVPSSADHRVLWGFTVYKPVYFPAPNQANTATK